MEWVSWQCLCCLCSLLFPPATGLIGPAVTYAQSAARRTAARAPDAGGWHVSPRRTTVACGGACALVASWMQGACYYPAGMRCGPPPSSARPFGPAGKQ